MVGAETAAVVERRSRHDRKLAMENAVGILAAETPLDSMAGEKALLGTLAEERLPGSLAVEVRLDSMAEEKSHGHTN